MRASLPRAWQSRGHSWDVLLTLVGRELGIRYKGSALGLLWAVLSPLGTVAVMHLVFTSVLPLNIEHYAAYVYSGLLPFTWFQSAVLTSATTLFDNRDLVRRPFFSRLLLPAVVTATQFALYILAMPVLFALLAFEGVALSPALLLLPLVWAVLAVFTLACSVLVAALGVLMRDVQHILGVGMMLWFYLTPIFYRLDGIADSRVALLRFNPMALIVNAHRRIALEGRAPDWGELGLCLGIGLALLALAVTLFRTLEDIFVEEV
jgi:lipopolysaccharide transport system permease protein